MSPVGSCFILELRTEQKSIFLYFCNVQDFIFTSGGQISLQGVDFGIQALPAVTHNLIGQFHEIF